MRKIPSALIIKHSAAAAENDRDTGGRKTCADKRPVLYPNAHLKQVRHAAAQADIDACIQYAVEAAADFAMQSRLRRLDRLRRPGATPTDAFSVIGSDHILILLPAWEEPEEGVPK